MRRCSVVFGLAIGLMVTLVAGSADAMHPRELKLDVDTPPSGVMGRLTAQVRVSTSVKDANFLVVLRQRGGPGEPLPVRVDKRTALLVRAGAGVKASVPIQLNRAPKQAVWIDALIIDRSGRVVQADTVDLYFRVRAGRFTRTDYANLYMPKKLSGERRAREQMYELPVRRAVRPSQGHLRGSLLAFGSAMRPNAVTDLRPTLERFAVSQPEFRNKLLKRLSINDRWVGGAREFQLAGGGAVPYAVSGNFSFTGLDGAWHPAWNWLVRLSWIDGDGDDHELGLARVQPDGSWQATVSALGYSGQNLFVQYAPKSKYTHIVDRDGDDYWWYSPRRYNVATTVDMGAVTADTGPTASLMGLGDVYDHAMVFWNGFYTAGVNPARSESIKIYYPNTWYDCEGGYLWSCASPDGEIWVIPAHANAFTVQHELGHQLNYELWGDFAGGGEHSTWTCSQPEVALSEGFADSIPYWLTGQYGNQPPVVGGGPSDIETPLAGRCVGDWNEWHVATTFWDLVDRHDDGTDALALDPPILPMLVYLWAGQKLSLRFYLGDHMAFTPLPNDRALNVYRNNTIVP